MFGLKKQNALVKEQSDKSSKVKSGSSGALNSGKSLAAWSLQPAIAALCIVVALAVALEVVFVRSVESGQQKSINANYATLVQSDLNLMLKERTDVLKTIASTPELLDVLLAETAAGQALFTASFPDLQRLYVIPVSKLSKANALYPSLGYASIDAMRNAQSVDKLKLEAFFDGKAWYYQTALLVDGQSPSVVLFLFNADELASVLQTQAASLSGSISIVSGSKNDATTVMSFGSNGVGEVTTKPLAIGSWQLKYAASSKALVVIDRNWLWILMGVAALLTMLIVYLLCRVRLTSVKNDVVLASSLLLSGITGNKKKPERLKYHETVELLITANEALDKQSAKAAPSSAEPSKPKVKPVSPAATMEVQEVSASSDMDDDLNFDDLDLDEELGLNDDAVAAQPSSTPTSEAANIDGSIFRAYDIRGVVDEDLTIPGVELIGRALASQALSQGQRTICVGYDGRLSSESYCEAICRGVNAAGADAIVIGRVPTPVLYFSTHHLNTGTGIMITGSHNPSNYNGFKMMVDGTTLAGADIQALYQRIVTGDFATGSGSVSNQNVDQAYLDTIENDVAVAAPLKVVVDAGNGVAGELAPRLIEELGCDVIPLFCEIDGTFPNHHPDPGKPQNLQDLIAAVEEHDADLGLAFDGDGDRVGVVTNTGKIIWPDRLLMLFAKDVVSRNPGADVIYDVKCSRRLNGLISSYGGRPIMWKTGHSLIKAKMKETGALLAGEMSGHIFFKERWFGFDDGLYSAVRLLEILGIEDRSAEEVFEDFPEDLSTPEINITVTDESKFDLVEKLCGRAAAFEDGSVSTIDGLRVDFHDGWGLCRASNTTPVLVLRFEADDESALKRIQERFKEQLLAIDSSLDVGF